MLFGMPYLLSGNNIDILRIVKNSWIPLLFYALLFYTNYLYLIDRFFFKKNNTPFFLINLTLIAALVFLNYRLASVFLENNFPPSKNIGRPPRTFFIYLDSVPFIVPVVFSIALKMLERWKKSESEGREAEKAKLESELKHLKYQVQPHFFFNSLNNIYALVDNSPEKAKETIHLLGKIMRYPLYETGNAFVPLSKEIDFLKTYISMMETRLSKNTKVDYDFPKVLNTIKIAPLLFITLVENAFKHGVSASRPSKLYFEIAIKNGFVVFATKNTYFPKGQDDKSGSGIGLDNLKKRLDLLYSNEYGYAQATQEDMYYTTLSLPIR